MEAQEIFDKVARHLRDQGVRSMTSDGCAYRGANNTKCALGCLIEDSEYLPTMEGMNVDWLASHGWLPSRLSGSRRLLDRLQSVHDRALPENWAQSCAVVAKDLGLDATHLISDDQWIAGQP